MPFQVFAGEETNNLFQSDTALLHQNSGRDISSFVSDMKPK